jgi:hypothetical protein
MPRLFTVKHMTTNMNSLTPNTAHSAAWVFQVKAAFGLAVGGLAIGIAALPLDPWKRGFLALGMVFVVNATFSLSKTMRDEHEAKKVHTRLDDARLGRLLAEHDPFRDPLTGASLAPTPSSSPGFVGGNGLGTGQPSPVW